MFIEQGIYPENKFWKYIVGFFIVFIIQTLGQLPLLAAIFLKTTLIGKSFPTDSNKILKILDPNLTLFLLTLSFAFALLAIYFVVNYLHKQSFLSLTTSRNKVDWSRVFFSFFLWATISITMTLIDYYLNPKDFVINFHLIPFLILFVVAIIMIPLQTSCEEYLFRGYLMQGIGGLARNKWVPLVVTSLTFGLLHIANPEVDKMGYIILVFYIGTGFLLGIITLMDDGMELSLGFHAANNIVGALLVTTDWTVFQTNSIFKDIAKPEAGFDVILPVIVIYPILLFIFSKKYNWSNWSRKLTGKIETNY